MDSENNYQMMLDHHYTYYSTSLGTHPLHTEERVRYHTHHRVVSKEFNYLTTV